MHLLVLDPGDELVDCLTRFATERNLLGGTFHAIGAASRAVYAYWDRDRKVYDKFEIPEQMEVVSLSGSLARDEAGEVRIHAHVVFSGRDGSTIGGHLFEAHAYPTLEVFLTEVAVPLRRQRHPDTGLMLLDMEE
ncbi:MAG TPA: PPC domain-containing DNA-binding protein [Thermoanaerobaculia bacterium]